MGERHDRRSVEDAIADELEELCRRLALSYLRGDRQWPSSHELEPLIARSLEAQLCQRGSGIRAADECACSFGDLLEMHGEILLEGLPSDHPLRAVSLAAVHAHPRYLERLDAEERALMRRCGELEGLAAKFARVRALGPFTC